MARRLVIWAYGHYTIPNHQNERFTALVIGYLAADKSLPWTVRFMRPNRAQNRTRTWQESREQEQRVVIGFWRKPRRKGGCIEYCCFVMGYVMNMHACHMPMPNGGVLCICICNPMGTPSP